jgi:hypothetical protein
MASQQLVTALMGEDRFQREIRWISITLKRFRENNEQIILWHPGQSILRSTRLAVHMPVLNLPNEAQAMSNLNYPLQSAPALLIGKGLRTPPPFWHVCTLRDGLLACKSLKAEERFGSSILSDSPDTLASG